MDEIQQIAVLLTCHNRREKTLACLNALSAATLPEGYVLDIFLVDDGSTDGTGDTVKKNYSQINVIQGNGNLYWNRGMHLAWVTAAQAKEYDFYLWLNDDTIVFENALKTLLQTSEGLNHQSIVVGSTCSTNDASIVTYGGATHKGGVIKPSNIPELCDYFNGNIVLIPKFVYERVGMNDPIFHHYLGDFDYGLRAAKAGIQSFVAPKIIGKCNEHEVLSTWCNPNLSIKTRWKAFRTPLGQNPEEFFVFEKRHNGLVNAIFHYITNHLRVFCTILWSKKI